MRTSIDKILNETHLMSLATYGPEGLWVADVIFVADEDCNIYWFSKPGTRHSLNIRENSKVACTITHNTQAGLADLGLQIRGNAEPIGLLHPFLALNHWKKRGHKDLIDSATILKQGCSWYKLVPTEIHLIDEQKTGQDRVKFK